MKTVNTTTDLSEIILISVTIMKFSKGDNVPLRRINAILFAVIAETQPIRN